MAAVSVENIMMSYGKKKQKINALSDISFSVAAGELFGIIGPDGAGKTSLFRILTTLLLADSGQASVNGFDVVKDMKQIRKRIGYMPGRFSLYQDLTVEENLHFFATIFQTSFSENYNLIKDIYVQIEPFKNRRAGQLSGGMKQKLALCCALIHRPEVLFLDEPTTGVDAVSRKEFWDMLQGLKKQGISILVSTPYMDEANICDRVALLQKGKILSIDSPAGVIAHFKNPLVAVKAKQMLALLEKIKTLDFVQDAYPFGEFHHVVLQNEKAVPSLEQELEAADLGHITMHKVQANIEDCFIQLMKN